MTSLDASGRLLDIGLHLLDRQVVDCDGRLVCNVDDLELTDVDGVTRVTAILVGPGALGPRIGGLLGRLFIAAHRRFKGFPSPNPPRIPMSAVEEIGSSVTLNVPLRDLDVVPLEDWVREHLIRHIPGARHASE
jgi:sporulation protein YlmC with PRC-barrel domain